MKPAMPLDYAPAAKARAARPPQIRVALRPRMREAIAVARWFSDARGDHGSPRITPSPVCRSTDTPRVPPDTHDFALVQRQLASTFASGSARSASLNGLASQRQPVSSRKTLSVRAGQIARHEYDTCGQRRAGRRQQLVEGAAIHARHLDVAHDEVELPTLNA